MTIFWGLHKIRFDKPHDNFSPPMAMDLPPPPFAGRSDDVRRQGSPKDKYLLFVGTYTQKESKGIYAYRFDAASSELTPLGVAAETTNPSFLAIDPSHRFLFAVNEVQKYKGADSGAVSAFAINRETGKLSLLNEVASAAPTRATSPSIRTGKYVLVANYTGGNVAVFPIHADGRLGESSASSRTWARSDLLRSVRKRRTVIGSRPPPTTASCTCRTWGWTAS